MLLNTTKEERNECNSPFHTSLLKIMDEYYQIDHKKDYIIEPFQTFGIKQGSILSNTNKLKILYVTFLKYPNTGGLSNYITSLKTGFEKYGHDVDVISPTQMTAVHLEQDIPKAAQCARDFMLQRYGIVNEKIIKNTSFLNVFKSFLRERSLEKYDVFHAQDLFSVFLLGQLNLAYKKPLFFTPHGHFTKSRVKFDKIKKGSIEEAYFSEIEKQGIRAADQIITISNSFHPPLKDYGAKTEQLITVHTGIHFQQDFMSKQECNNNLVISCISRLSPRKGHDIFLKALSQIQQDLSNVEVWIVGDGVMREKLENQVIQLGLDNIKFFGRRTDIPEILSSSAIYVLPTINDNFPISVIEAMFSRQAIITTNCGGIPEMIQNGKTGIICEPGNVQQLSDALKLLLTNKDLREQLGREAQVYSRQHLTQDVMVSKIERIYYSFMSNI
ncbi:MULTISPECIES: glycosyltransferase family 4 protein [unclassified Bacillus (in: firmicutes)]|uniref:glycosyltransferase family 4 protein n=1 Tax=unclassified Bacillus (in: firmicutes) TaxID=185979 RepID=UPI0008F21404|nr:MULTISPECIES: glycosyltransferase family 4 protein [unclassified Bacillus (in: firmicutes)]SFI38287.1 Glycosyltransferase involved in cell wall bisynthesis [Bacillus sp. 71mf]SFT11225.1 Glycosyltransferase involved in cell wall bisynthesis [Bacillus sp. 103mf]